MTGAVELCTMARHGGLTGGCFTKPLPQLHSLGTMLLVSVSHTTSFARSYKAPTRSYTTPSRE